MGRRVWPFALGLVGVAIAVVVALPTIRLNAEIAAARREGLWTSAQDVRKGLGTVPEDQNAAPLIRRAIANNRLTLGSKIGTSLVTQEANLKLWREASARPRLDYGRPWEKGYAMLLPEYAEVRRGIRGLIQAAKDGRDPQENLLAAARLTALIRQEPILTAQIVGVADGRKTLAMARKLGLGKPVEAALGPPPDARWANKAEAAAIIESIEGIRRRDKEYGAISVWDGLLTSNLPSATTKVAVLRAYRGLNRDLPKQATDYDSARRAVKRWAPQYQDAVCRNPVLGRYSAFSTNTGSYLEEFETFQKERAEARRGR